MSAKKCINLSNIDASISCSDSFNMGGLVPRVVFGYHDDVDVWPDFPDAVDTDNGTELSAAGELDSTLAMKTGKRAFELHFTEDTGSFSIAPQGDKGNISFLYTLAFINKRVRSHILGFLNASKNRKMFFLVQDANGKWYLMGDKFRGAMLSPSDGAVTGAASTDPNQVTTTFTYTSPGAYMMDVDFAPDDLLVVASGT